MIEIIRLETRGFEHEILDHCFEFRVSDFEFIRLIIQTPTTITSYNSGP